MTNAKPIHVYSKGIFHNSNNNYYIVKGYNFVVSCLLWSYLFVEITKVRYLMAYHLNSVFNNNFCYQNSLLLWHTSVEAPLIVLVLVQNLTVVM